MLSPKTAQCFEKAINFYEFRGLTEWRELVENSVAAAVEQSASNACLRCMHACISVESWLEGGKKRVAISHRGCARFVRLEMAHEDRQDLSLDIHGFWCPWEERGSIESGGSDE